MTTIDHTIPTGETISFTVTLRSTEGARAVALIEYPAALDMSQWSVRDAYPVAAIELAVASAAKVDSARFTHCDGYGAEASTWEEWHFATETHYAVDTGSDGYDETVTATDEADALAIVGAHARPGDSLDDLRARGWTVDRVGA